MRKFEPGEYFIYVNGSSYELGRVKRNGRDKDTYYCWYHAGETAALTHERDMHKLNNRWYIDKTSLGGEDAGRMYEY